MISLTDKQQLQKSFFRSIAYQQLLSRLSSFQADSKPKWGRMTPAQTLMHLDKAIGCGVGQYQFSNISNVFTRTIVKWLVIDILPRFPHNARTGSMLKVQDEPDFIKAKQKLLQTLELAYHSTQNEYPHPLFGNLTKSEWGVLVFKHLDHHLRQFGL